MHREHHGNYGPHWRFFLEARWRERLREVTELSLAYHGAAAETVVGLEDAQARRLLGQAVDARRRLADTEEALGRLAAGDFGRCEQCRALIPDRLLASAPETRYCPDCMAEPVPARHAPAGR